MDVEPPRFERRLDGGKNTDDRLAHEHVEVLVGLVKSRHARRVVERARRATSDELVEVDE